MADFNLSNVKKEIDLELEQMKKDLPGSSYEKAKALWSMVQDTPARIETTKANIKKFGYEGILGSLCTSQNVDKLLFLAFIMSESNGDPTVINEYGYCGCLQVHPDYFKQIGYSEAEFRAATPQVKAQKGIEAGIHAFKEKVSCFPDNIWLAMTAFNAGQGAFDSAWQGKDTSAMRWWNNIENVAAAGQSFYSSIPTKYEEIGKYAIRIMYAYSLLQGTELSVGTLPTAVSLPSSSSSSGGNNPLSALFNSPASITVKQDGAKSHRKHCNGSYSDPIYKAPDKLYCEPVYPDYVAVNKGVPEYAIDSSIKAADKKKVAVEANMVYSLDTLNKEYQDINAQIDSQRSAIFNKNAKHIERTEKAMSTGKPINNKDPFPVDAKIEEFELHQPRCKINRIVTCPEGVEASKAAIQLSINVEQRLVRIENNLATILRYLARYAARVPINCAYYGGQNIYQKYKCIRCLKDDRLSDGQSVSFDQCLNCTRYEPILGQVYDIMDENGINLAQVLDDCQMSYASMDEYCDFISGQRHQKPLESVGLDKANVKTRKATDKGFEWSDGLKTSWKLVPVEDQVPHINKIQDVNGTQYESLASYQNNLTNAGMNYCASGLTGLLKVKEEMDQVIDGSIISQL